MHTICVCLYAGVSTFKNTLKKRLSFRSSSHMIDIATNWLRNTPTYVLEKKCHGLRILSRYIGGIAMRTTSSYTSRNSIQHSDTAKTGVHFNMHLCLASLFCFLLQVDDKHIRACRASYRCDSKIWRNKMTIRSLQYILSVHFLPCGNNTS